MLHSRQHGDSGKPKCVNRYPRRVNFTCCGHASAMEQEHNQSHPPRSYTAYVTKDYMLQTGNMQPLDKNCIKLDLIQNIFTKKQQQQNSWKCNGKHVAEWQLLNSFFVQVWYSSFQEVVCHQFETYLK